MTVDLEELKRLAQAAADDVGLLAPARLEFRSKIDPAAVLALIERVEELENRANVAFGWNTQNCPTATQCVLESIVLRKPMPDAEKLEAFAKGDRARSSEEGQSIALNQRVKEARAPLLDRASKLEAALNGLRDDVTGALAEAERQAKGASGMSVPYTGPFASGLRLPSVVRDLREQRRILDAALEAK
jgi:hypothetical protein